VQPSGPMLLDYKTIILTGGFVTLLERLRKSPQYYCRQTVEFLKHKIRSFAAQYPCGPPIWILSSSNAFPTPHYS
jgi:hypothetical protein